MSMPSPLDARPNGRRSAARIATAITFTSAFALLLSACSGGIANQTTPSSAGTGNATCGTTITIGAPNPLSGPLTDFGTNAIQGTQIAAAEINAAGGIKALGGAKIKIETGDTGSSDPSQATSATTKLIEDGSVALVGAWLSGLTTTVSTVAEQASVPILSQSWADTLSQRSYQFYFQPPPKSSQIGGAATSYVVAAAKSVGVTFTKVAGVGPNDVANTAQITAAVNAFKAAGASADAPTFFQAGITDATPIITRLAAQNADLLLVSGTPADVSLIVKGLRARNITTPILGFGGAFVVPSFAKVMGDQVNGLIAVGAWNWDLPLPGVKAAAAAYKKKYGEFMPMEAGESWVDVHLIADAMEKAKSCKPTEIAAALHSIDVTSGPGSAMPGGEVSFNADGTNPHAVPVLTQWKNNQPATVWPQKYATTKIDFGK
ncbi:ABC transporter substrate-binding protein [Lysinimonas soli]|uniref:ABC transporter substrate-binding protein n=1 Tax=Lysinimonas soli TaxID=1074233 RepID=A0ABW0NT67_9MICO